jgi:hypothetical protein
LGPLLKPLFKVDATHLTWKWLLVAALALVPVSIIEVTKLVKSGRIRSHEVE